jgi:hypothetical protein
LKWDDGQAAGTVQAYSFVLKGNWVLFESNYSVKGGTYYEVKSPIQAPLKGPEEKSCADELAELRIAAKARIATSTCAQSSYKVVDTCTECKQNTNTDRVASTEWSVKFMDATYDAAKDQTTFLYNLTAKCAAECRVGSKGSSCKDLSHWTLALDSCVFTAGSVTSSKTPTSLGCDPTTGSYGFKFDAGQKQCTSQVYDVIVKGNVAAGVSSYTVKGGTYYSAHPTIAPSSGVKCEVERDAIKAALAQLACPEITPNSAVSFSIGFLTVLVVMMLF